MLWNYEDNLTQKFSRMTIVDITSISYRPQQQHFISRLTVTRQQLTEKLSNHVDLTNLYSKSEVYPILSKLFNPDFGHTGFSHTGFGHSDLPGKINNVLFSKQHFDLLYSFFVDYKVEDGGHSPVFVLLKRK
jgi:hypothetical protein